MIHWFGVEPFSPVCMDTPREPIPIGEPCFYCGEPIGSTDSGYYYSGGTEPAHLECFMRPILGSVGHQQRKCRCYGGHEEDPPGLTKRQAAQAALAHAQDYQCTCRTPHCGHPANAHGENGFCVICGKECWC